MITNNNQVLRIRQVCALTGLSRSSIYNKLSSKAKQHDASFPRPFKLGASAVGWSQESVNNWIMARASRLV